MIRRFFGGTVCICLSVLLISNSVLAKDRKDSDSPNQISVVTSQGMVTIPTSLQNGIVVPTRIILPDSRSFPFSMDEWQRDWLQHLPENERAEDLKNITDVVANFLAGASSSDLHSYVTVTGQTTRVESEIQPPTGYKLSLLTLAMYQKTIVDWMCRTYARTKTIRAINFHGSVSFDILSGASGAAYFGGIYDLGLNFGYDIQNSAMYFRLVRSKTTQVQVTGNFVGVRLNGGVGLHFSNNRLFDSFVSSHAVSLTLPQGGTFSLDDLHDSETGKRLALNLEYNVSPFNVVIANPAGETLPGPTQTHRRMTPLVEAQIGFGSLTYRSRGVTILAFIEELKREALVHAGLWKPIWKFMNRAEDARRDRDERHRSSALACGAI